MQNRSGGNAVKLYVFVDRLENESERPLLVIINRFKQILDLKLEFSKNHNFPFDDQFWVINNYCYPIDAEIDDALENCQPFQGGYIVYMFIINYEEKLKIPNFIEIYLEEKYTKIDPGTRWRDPVGEPIIIADTVDTKKPLPFIGWTCDTCSMANRAYKECCDACGNSRSLDYRIPRNYIWTEEDLRFLREMDEEKKRQIEMEEKHKQQMEKDRLECRQKLELMYKDKVSFTTEMSECPICMLEYPAGESVILHSCFHTVCKDCFKGYLTTAADPRVKCPTENCVGIIEDGEISAILSEEEYKNYEQLSLRTAESKAGNTFHCSTPNCTAWVVYDDNVNFFDCPLCIKQNCLSCKAIHEKQNCKEYQEELVIKARNDEAARKDLEFLENMIKNGEAMNCPTCKIMIQKKQGCDWMMCNMCKTELCWATKGPRWGPKGRRDTSGGCRCGVNGVKCHPLCKFCH